MSAYRPWRALKVGDEGADVLACQLALPFALKRYGKPATCHPTGVYDAATANDVRVLTGHVGKARPSLTKQLMTAELVPWWTWMELRDAALDENPDQPELRRRIDARRDIGADVLAVKYGLHAMMNATGRHRFAPAPDFALVDQGGRRFAFAVEWLQSAMGWKETGKVGQPELAVVWAFMNDQQRKRYHEGPIQPTPPKPRPVKVDPRTAAVELMLSWEGQTEKPAGSNIFPPLQGAVARLVNRGVKVPAWQRPGGFAWCVWACFVALADKGSASAVAEIEKSNAAYTVTVLEDAQKGKNGLSIVTRNPRRGDIVLFDLPAGDKVDHAGLLLSATKSTVTCIEGNTSSGSIGSQSNGGGCYRRTRPRSQVRAIVRVAK